MQADSIPVHDVVIMCTFINFSCIICVHHASNSCKHLSLDLCTWLVSNSIDDGGDGDMAE